MGAIEIRMRVCISFGVASKSIPRTIPISTKSLRTIFFLSCAASQRFEKRCMNMHLVIPSPWTSSKKKSSSFTRVFPIENSTSSEERMRHTAILSGPDTHLDHLGVLSSLLKIPLIVTEEKNFRLAKALYPNLNPELKGLDELTIEHLAYSYDVIYETGKFFAAQLKPFLKLLFQKEMRFVFCPHGNSDKGHSIKNHIEQDISLVYGEHLYDLLKRTSAADKIRHIVKTGNYRFSYYLKYRQFFDALAQDTVFSHFKNEKPILIYAPTWNDAENPTTFFTETERLIEELSPSYNLIIKPHPFLAEHHPARAYRLMALYENHPSALFLVDF